MKKLISIILLLILLTGLSACHIVTDNAEDGKLSIIATIFPQYDFARQITGDKASVSMLISPGAESHSFEPTTSDILEISKCDIFIYTGGESDNWIDGILENVNNPQMTVIALTDCVELLDTDHAGESDHSNHNHGKVDEHVWTSPVNAIAIAEKICDEICIKDNENADFYKANLDSYTNDLTELDKDFRKVTQEAKRNTLIFGDRFPLQYFAAEYGLEYFAAFPGCSEDTEASASTVASLIDKVREEQIPAVLKIELSSDATAKTICSATGAEMLTFYSCHNISKDDFDASETYLSLMQKNVETLKTALN